jgi:outer membrane immunogenic protein
MNKLLTSVSVAALMTASILATPVFAADLPPAPEPIPISAPDWTGFYVGGHAGYGWGDVNDGYSCGGDGLNSSWVAVYEPGNPAVDPCYGEGLFALGSLSLPSFYDENIIGYSQSEDLEGWLAGVQLGYNYQMGNVVIGGEVAGSVSSITATRLGATLFEIETPFPPCEEGCIGPVGYSGRYDVNWIVTADAKVGWATDMALLYLKGGLSLVNTSNNNTLGFDDDSVTTAGWNVGGGVEGKIGGTSLTWFAEYLYHQVDGVEHLGSSLVLLPTAYKSDLELHTFKIGFNKLFQ